MKQVLIGLVLGVLFAACTVAQPTPTDIPTSVPIAQLPTIALTTIPPTEMPTQLSSTPAFLIATATPTFTLTPSATPTTTETPMPPRTSTRAPDIIDDPSLPPLAGKIFFLWDPDPIPAERGIGELTESNLYKTFLSNNNWYIEPIIEVFGEARMLPSSDSMNLGLLRYDDTNGDGVVDTQRGVDISNIYSYNIADNALTQLTEGEFNPLTFSWSPTAFELAYPQRNDIFLIDLTSSIPEGNSIAVFPDRITKLAWSPQKDLLAINRFPGNIELFDMKTGEIISVLTEIDYQLTLEWAPNAEWLSVAGRHNQGLRLVNIETLEDIFLLDSSTSGFSEWSPTEPMLAFTDRVSLSLFNADSDETVQLISLDYLNSPSWSPNGNNLAIGYMDGGESGVLIIDLITGNQKKLNMDMTIGQIIWAPDGEWLLFFSESDNGSGLYMVSKNNSIPFLFLDTTGRPLPYNIYWLSEK